MGLSVRTCSFCNFFFFNDTATTEIYTLSLHDALPICSIVIGMAMCVRRRCWTGRSALLFPQDALAPLCLVGPTSGTEVVMTSMTGPLALPVETVSPRLR